MALLFPAGQQFGDSNMDPVGAGKLYIYDNGTTNAASAYSDPDLSTGALSSPVVLDSSGRLTTNVYVDGTALYTVKLDTSADAELWSRDDVMGWGEGTLYDGSTARLVAMSNGIDVLGPVIDLDNSSSGDVTSVFLRNSEGGVRIKTDGGAASIVQTSSTGIEQDVWIDFVLNGLVALRYNGTVALRTSAAGVEVRDTSGSLPTIDFRTDAGATNNRIFSGSGSPEGVVTAEVGSLFMRTDGGAGTSLYVKESGTGNTGWAGV